VSGRAHGGVGAGSSLIIGQPDVWSAGSRLIIVVRIRPRSLARSFRAINLEGFDVT